MLIKKITNIYMQIFLILDWFYLINYINNAHIWLFKTLFDTFN